MAILNLEAFRKIQSTRVYVPKRTNNKKSQQVKTRKSVLSFIKSHELTTIPLIVKATELASSTVYRVISELEASELIVRVMGNGKSNYGNSFFKVAKG